MLFVLPSLAPGGIERHFVRQARYFDRDRFAVQLATLFYYPEKTALYDALPPDIPYTVFRFRGYADWRSLIAFARFLYTAKPDIVVSSMFSANTLVRLLSIIFGFAAIAREHNVYSEKRRWQHWVDRLLSRYCYRVVAVSDEVARFAAAVAGIPQRRLTVIPNGIDIAEVERELARADAAAIRTAFGIGPGEKIIINAARLKEQKNHALLLRAFARFSERAPEYRLIIIGEGNERPQLERLVRELGLERKVSLPGFRPDVYAFYAAADFFVLSSRREGFPNVVLEAFAAGLPVVSTPVAGVGEIIRPEENGLIVPAEVPALAAAFARLAALAPAERAAWSAAARDAAARFDMAANVARYEALFEQCYNR